MDFLKFLDIVDQDQTTDGIPGLNDPQLRSFKQYFSAVFTSRFGPLTPEHIIRFGLLNFVCQQLAVRAAHAPQENILFFYGSGLDFAASLVGMVPMLKAVWLRSDGDTWGVEWVEECLRKGEDDDLTNFTLCHQPLAAAVSAMSERSLGAAVLTGDVEAPADVIQQLINRLSVGGIVLYSAAHDSELHGVTDEYERISFNRGRLSAAFRGGLFVIRRKW